LVPLTNVPLLNDDWAVPETVPDIPLTDGVDQLYVVPLGTTVEDEGEPFEGVNEYEPPEQITSV
jgi:hypothetical protein